MTSRGGAGKVVCGFVSGVASPRNNNMLHLCLAHFNGNKDRDNIGII